MILGLEIGMLIFGFIALVTGKLKLSAGNEVQGAPARLLGAVAILPLPLALGIIILMEVMAGPGGDMSQGAYVGIELGIVGICALIVFGGGAMVANSQRAERGSRRRILDDLDDDEPRPRRRRVEPDDDWDAPVPRERGRRAGEEPDVAIKADARDAVAPQAPPADTIECPGCKWRLRVSAQLVGKQVRCQNCKQVFRATAPGTTPPS